MACVGGQDVRLGERAVERRAAMAAGAEADELIGVGQVGLALVIIALQFRHINQQVGGSGLSGKWIQSHARSKQSRRGGVKGKMLLVGINVRNAHPHPGLLPQEKENRSPPLESCVSRIAGGH